MSTIEAIAASLRIALNLPEGGKWGAVLKKGTYDSMPEDQRKTLAGRETTSWDDFTNHVIDYQRELGLTWQVTKGPGPPLAFVRFLVPRDLGEQIAREGFSANSKGGSFNSLLFEKLDLDQQASEKLKRGFDIDWSAAKEAFSKYIDRRTNESFKFAKGPGQDQFHRSKNEVAFNGKETILHTKLEEAGSLRQELGLAAVRKSRGLGAGKYRNVDLVGYRLLRQKEGDSLELAAIEVKKDNTVASVMQAIAQATSYRSIAERSYIAIPGFNESDYHDPEGFERILDICEDNQIGVVSIQLKDNNTDVEAVSLEIDATRQAASEPGLKDQCVGLFGLQFCHVCRRWIPKDIEGTPADCGWIQEGKCMRLAILSALHMSH